LVQRVCQIAAGNEDCNDADYLRIYPALRLTQSLCVSLGIREGRCHWGMRLAPVAAGVTLMARAMVLPWFRHLNRDLTRNCLIVTAQPRKG
jgi:hypothetical protein